jgi:hypothetical protein
MQMEGNLGTTKLMTVQVRAGEALASGGREYETTLNLGRCALLCR